MFTLILWAVVYVFVGFASIIAVELIDGPLDRPNEYSTSVSVLVLWPIFWIVVALISAVDGIRLIVRFIRKKNGTRR